MISRRGLFVTAALVAAFLLVATNARAQSWSLADMNRAIEQTNFIVNSGCSGTLISVPEKLVLTNYHCVDRNVTSFEREVTDRDGFVKKVRLRKYSDVKLDQNHYDGYARVGSNSYLAEIVAEDQRRDLAIVKIKSPIPQTYASPIAKDGEEAVRGERVYIVGNPAGNDSTVVEGVVSNVNRTFEFPWTDNAKLPMVQFSGGITGGNSGGALYNARGVLIGVPAAGHSSAMFIGLAVPASIVKAFMRENCMARIFDDKANDGLCRAAKLRSEATGK